MGKNYRVKAIREKEQIEEMKYHLLKSSYRDYFLFMLGINTGFRISDLLQLKVADVKSSHIRLREMKTRKAREIKLNPTARELVDEYIQGKNDEEYLFPSKKTKRPIGRIQAYKILNNAAAKCGLEQVGTHTLRKTFGYHFYRKTKNVALLQKIFNHSYPSETLIYIGIEQDEMDEAMDSFGL